MIYNGNRNIKFVKTSVTQAAPVLCMIPLRLQFWRRLRHRRTPQKIAQHLRYFFTLNTYFPALQHLSHSRILNHIATNVSFPHFHPHCNKRLISHFHDCNICLIPAFRLFGAMRHLSLFVPGGCETPAPVLFSARESRERLQTGASRS